MDEAIRPRRPGGGGPTACDGHAGASDAFWQQGYKWASGLAEMTPATT